MEPVTPVFENSDGLEHVYQVQDEPEKYIPLPAFRTEKAVISRWRLTDTERQYIANGGDLFIAMLNFGQPIWPILPIAAEPDQALAIALEVEANV